MKKKKLTWKLLNVLLGIALAVGTLAIPVKAENDDSLPETIKMPVSIYDYLNDGLLFEYPMADIGLGLSLYTEGIESDLIEFELDPIKKTPVYKQETVEKVANIVKELMESGYNGGKTDEDGNATNEVYKALYQQITGFRLNENIPAVEILPNQDYFTEAVKPLVEAVPESNKTFKEMGWTLKDENGIETDENSSAWNKDGDWLKSNQTGATAEFSFGTLPAGTYGLQYYAFNNMEGSLVLGEKRQSLTTNQWCWNDDYVHFTLTQDTEVKIQFKVTAENAEFCHGKLVALDTGEVLRENFCEYEKNPAQPAIFKDESHLSYYGIEPSDTIDWRVGPYGITSGEMYDPNIKPIYIIKEVEPGKLYNLSYESERCVVTVSTNDANNTILEDLNTTKTDKSQKFRVPEGVNSIKITISQLVDPNYKAAYHGIREMYLQEVPEAALGNYDEAKEKFSNNGGKFADISTCMDYAYYMLNNFWSSTGNDITQKTTNYTTLTLKKSDDGYYKIDQNNLVYDLENKTIYKDERVSQNNGFFPLDQSVLGDKNDLTGRFGVNDGEISFENKNHNYHFATKAHTEFIYEKGMKFEFTGDDDVYLFVNGKKVLDIGGAHESLTKTVDFDTLGLTEGEVYSMDFFHLERHAWASNFSISTNISFNTPKAKSSVNFIDDKGNILNDKSKVQLGDELGIEYSITGDSKGTNDEPWLTNVSFIDTSLGIVIKGNSIDENGNVIDGEITLTNEVYIKNNLTVTVLNQENKVKETVAISKEDFNDENKRKEFINTITKLKIDKGQTITVNGLYKKVGIHEFVSNLTATLDVKVNEYNEETYEIDEIVKTAITTSSFKVIPENTPLASIKALLTDSNGTPLSTETEISEGTNIYVEYNLEANSDLMKGIRFDDLGTGIKLSKDGITLPDGYDIDKNIVITWTTTNSEGKTITTTKTISKEELSHSIDVLDEKSENAWILNKNDTIKITGIYTTLTKDSSQVETQVTAELKGPTFNYDEQEDVLTVNYMSPSLKSEYKINKKATYDVLFTIDENKGNFIGNTTYRVAKDEKTEGQPTINSTHFTLSGWTIKIGDAQATNLPVGVEPKDIEITNDTTFEAILTPKEYHYTVKYVDTNNHELSQAIEDNVNYSGEYIQIPVKDIEGYTLQANQPTTAVIDENNKVITLVYDINEYSVHFAADNNGTVTGDAEIINQTVSYNDKVSKVPVPEANSDYCFIGWYIGEEKIEDPTQVSIIADTTFTAKFERLYDVTFEIETEEGTLNGVTDYKVLKDTSTGNQPTVEANEHYNFIGWKIKNGSEQLVEPSTAIITADTIFKAILSPKEYHYTVEYVDTEGNRLADAVVGTQTYGENAVEEAINIEHYTLQGETTQTVLIDGDNKVITFVYDINKYPVHFVADDNGTVKGEETVINQAIEYNKTISELPIPEANTGYHFAGWYMGEEKIEDLTQISIIEETTFTAKICSECVCLYY